MYLVCGNIIAQRLTDNTLKKVPMSEYNSHSYVDLFKAANEMNQPHLDRLKVVFDWIDNQKTPTFELAEELTSMIKKKAKPDHRDAATHQKYLYLAAYNEYYDVNYHPKEAGLGD